MINKIGSKKELAKILSKLEGFYEPKVIDEQYSTDSETAAELLWNAYFLGDCEEKVILDLGCGNGQLGLGALILRARKSIFLDKDKDALQIAEKNYELLKNLHELGKIGEAIFLEIDVGKITEKYGLKADVVIQNPPFGTKQKHADTLFLTKAFTIAPVIYTIHKATTKTFINKVINQNKYTITHYFETNMPLKKSMKFHKSRKKEIKIGIWRIERTADQSQQFGS